uniref:protein kinase domain-containing protein n=1 Tax=Arsenicibacter rosenii TaxID=1750698 RepID=UPI0035B5972D
MGELGRSNARVLKARHRQTGELVAIKHFAFNTDAGTLRRFQRESDIMTTLAHPNVVKIKEVHFDADLPYIVMELIEGGDVRSLLKNRHQLDAATTIRLGLQMAEALKAIHEAGIVHRDIKPDNIMFRQLQSGELHFLLTDFGIARFREQPNTVTGHSAMTYEYASPEQFHDPSSVTEATDFYSLGVVLYECLTGQVPFVLGDFGIGLLSKRIENETPAPLPAGLPVSLRQVVEDLLCKQPADRLTVAGELKRKLKRADLELDDEPQSIPAPVTPVIAVAPVVPPAPPVSGTATHEPAKATLPAPSPHVAPARPAETQRYEPVKAVQPSTRPPYVPPANVRPPDVRGTSQPGPVKKRSGDSAILITLILVVVMLGFVWYYHSRREPHPTAKASQDTVAVIPADTTEAITGEMPADTALTESSESPENPVQELLDQGSQYYAQNNFTEAFRVYKQAADEGNSEAQNWIGLLYDQGKGVGEDQTEATNWYRKSATQGNPFGQYNLGAQYYNGEGVEQDYKQAFDWYAKAAEQGNTSAENGLGDLYYFGYGVTQSNADAVQWYRRAADHGNAFGQYNMGWMYENGYGVDKNVDQAVRLYQSSAKQGNAFSIKALRRLGYNVREYRAQ